MNSRLYNSEKVLAELGCSHLQSVNNAQVLVAGLGTLNSGAERKNHPIKPPKQSKHDTHF
jgi:hypothetical protein